MQPIFKNATVTRDDIGPFMREYAEENDIISTPRRGSYHGDKILLATPLLQWYLAHGLVVDRVYQIVEYERKPCFRQFGESVSTARRAGIRRSRQGNNRRYDEATRQLRVWQNRH